MADPLRAEVRARARAVPQADPDRAMASLQEIRAELEDPAEEVRLRAIARLRNDFSADVLAFLGDRAVHDPSARVRIAALRLLSIRGSREVRGLMVKSLSDPDPDVREAVLWLLVRSHDPEISEMLVEESGTGMPGHAQIQALGMLGGDRALAYLVKVYLTVPERAQAAFAALVTAGQPAIDFLEADIAVPEGDRGARARKMELRDRLRTVRAGDGR